MLLTHIPQSDGYLQISEAINGNRYHWSTGSTFDDNNGAKTYNNAVNLSGTYPVQFNTGLSNADAGNFTIRVYGDAADCFTDLVVSLNTQDCLVGCGCTDYVYLNDAPLSEVHKFEVLPDGSLSEIGSPWIGSTGNDPNQQPVRYPHGIATDVNGFVYVGDVDNFTNNGGGIVKLSCDGTVLEDRIPGPTNWGYNMDIVDNNLHIPGFNGVEIWDVCEGTQLGNLAYTEAPTNSWGFVIDVNEMYYYRTTGWVDGGTNKIIRGNLDGV